MDDAFVRDGTYASQNFGQATTLEVKNVGAVGYSRQSYFDFDLNGVGPSAGIVSAKVRLFGNLLNTAAASADVGLYPTATTWTENGLTFNNKPAASATPVGAGSVTGTAAKWYEFDVTNYVKQLRDAAQASFAFAVKAPAVGEGWAGFNSDEAATNRPELVVVQQDTPTPTPTRRRRRRRRRRW